ncbi:MAG: 2-oxo-4-hydroxy-4-carboxy-5-ureidoimidazoline decarboxylase [Aquabacterium sp.]|uniref:2-oxo-4-hydroxy-4-carboxy-5-ureidoimidazoline decarboxylase n=1 Tax=Aquabacterium sp. TaxID=1872578 RepID=UPI0025C3DE26|nr:2-oxo-4-hydroxy-4-carboxy-5-ureidoimidazoline decarboxylase [Aquabacterium sp.]MBI5925772.1 2-oxo-4-hydroxy-4-carboxy-5-ureidoimidazoline decarboxylase [Aquabacterium sp.]
MSLTLDQLNAAGRDSFVALLDGVYEHSPWIADAAWSQRPFKTIPQLKYTLAQVVRQSGEERQKGLIRAHPELAGKAAVAGQLTAESTNEQSRAGLTHCTAQEFARLQQLNADYNARFGWPFILAVRGPRGLGLTREQIIDTFARRLDNPADFELAECLRNIHRIAEIRLHDKFGTEPVLGNLVWDWAESLAAHSEPGYAEQGQLTVTYMTPAHQACAAQLTTWMQDCGFDEVSIDAVGNVVGIYQGSDASAPRLLTGSHYDTVRNGGKYDGRLGIFVPMACVRELHRQGRRLKYGIEVIGFAEEEGQRFKATFLGSGALVGDFPPSWLDQQDADGISLREAMQAAGLSASLADIHALKRDPARYLGFVEVHIEQGPWLDEIDQPLGVVTAINGSARYAGEVIGQASHAGTTPMDRRKDAAAAVAELVLYVEQRAAWDAHSPQGPSVGTVGVLNVPSGSVNVVPGRCQFTLDLRAPDNAQRDALVADVHKQLAAICERRGLRHTLTLSMQASAAPSDPSWQARWEAAVMATGLPVFKLPSGAGHDAMKLHECMPQAMLFVRGGNAGISHNPLETITNDDAQLCVDAFMHLLEQL